LQGKVWLIAKECVADYSAEKSLRAHNLLEGMAGSQGMEVAVVSERVKELMILIYLAEREPCYYSWLYSCLRQLPASYYAVGLIIAPTWLG